MSTVILDSSTIPGLSFAVCRVRDNSADRAPPVASTSPLWRQMAERCLESGLTTIDTTAPLGALPRPLAFAEFLPDCINPGRTHPQLFGDDFRSQSLRKQASCQLPAFCACLDVHRLALFPHGSLPLFVKGRSGKVRVPYGSASALRLSVANAFLDPVHRGGRHQRN